MMKIKKI